MGDHEEWSTGLLPNGLLPNAGPLLETLDSVRWLKAEERTAELIACIQPNQPSEERRNAVADYVQRLIMKCFPCQVFTFGSVPLKTYLPDGDIDLTAFSNNANLKDSWASEVRDMLETEEKNENAEFRVKEVQYIQAEVKIIKCLVENIVVDISFNQLGGLCTLCFLEEVDNLINQNHLFKRSIILIKAWCYYESRILGAHHGLISTYALETLVLYIFHVFNNSFAGPLEVLYRFLEFFSNFDWENFCVSLWGPVPVSSLPDVTAEAPRKDSGELLLNKVFLDSCSSVYAVFPGGQDNQGQVFVSKHFNVIDPLRVSNNLGRSVSKGNFFRIRSAFAFGAKRLARLLNCPQESLVAEVNQFFTNTWDRHGSGIRPDAPATDNQPVTDNIANNNSTGKKLKEFIDRENNNNNINNNNNNQLESSVRTGGNQNQKGHGNLNRGQKNLISGQLVNDIQKSPFARTQSSPELTDSYNNGPSQSGKNQTTNRRKNIEPESSGFDGSVDPNNGSGSYQHEGMHQEEQDLVNLMASSGLNGLHGFNGPVQMPAGHLPFPLSPSFLAGMGYAQRNFPGMIPANFPMIDPAFSGMQFPHGFVPHFFNGLGLTTNAEDTGSVAPADHDVGGFEPERMSSEIVATDDKHLGSVSSGGLNYVPPPRRVGGSGGLVRNHQHKYNKEKRGPLRDDSEPVSDERSTSSRFSSAAHSKGKTSSESSWDETSTVNTVNKSTKEKRGKKSVVSAESATGYVKGKNMSEDDDLDSDTTDRALNHGQRLTMPGYEVAQPSGSGSGSGSGSDSVAPMGPMVLGSNSRQRMTDNSGAMPLTFYPTGPPVPFFTMLPFYNVPSQPAPSDPSSIENGDLGPGTGPDPFRGPAPGDERKPDILNSDFASHWQNLQFGRFCQSPRQHGPAGYPSPLMVPPMYLQGRVPWDGPGRPVPNMNLVSQLMNYGPRVVPVSAPVSNRPPNVYQEIPRYRSGTGTYLPNPKVAVRDRYPSGPRRGGNNHDRSENHIDRENNWNANSKPRGSNRNHNRNQMDKSSSRLDRADRPVNSYRHDSFSTYQSQNGQTGQPSVGYGMYSNAGGPTSNGSTVPPMVMVYPYEHNAGFGSRSESLEFGSLGPLGYNEQAHINEGSRARGTFAASVQRSSPDQPSSPHHQRRV